MRQRKVTQKELEEQALKMGIAIGELSDPWCRKYVRSYILNPHGGLYGDGKPDDTPPTEREPSDASGFTDDFSIQTIRKR